MQLADLLREILDVNCDGIWENDRTPTSVRVVEYVCIQWDCQFGRLLQSSRSRWTPFADDTREANRLGHAAFEVVLGVNQHTRQIDDTLQDLDLVQAQSMGQIVDSLSQSPDYGGNIAETALQKAAPRP